MIISNLIQINNDDFGHSLKKYNQTLTNQTSQKRTWPINKLLFSRTKGVFCVYPTSLWSLCPTHVFVCVWLNDWQYIRCYIWMKNNNWAKINSNPPKTTRAATRLFPWSVFFSVDNLKTEILLNGMILRWIKKWMNEWTKNKWMKRTSSSLSSSGIEERKKSTKRWEN